MVKLTAIIVVYNKEICNSITYNNIKSRSDLDILFMDNSTSSTSNQQYCEMHGLQYISMYGNKGLSKAYNKAIEKTSNSDVLILLDDDTDIPYEYFDKLKKALLDFPEIDVFVPIIKGQDGIIYSPNSYNFFKNKLIDVPEKKINQEKFNAISSCMAIRMDVFKNYRYNEKLFVDEVDHCFCREQREQGRKFGILDVVVEQHFHQREKIISPKDAWNRIGIRITDIFRHARIMGGGKYTFLAFVKCCGLGIQIGKRSKSIGVISKSIGLSLNLLIRAR